MARTIRLERPLTYFFLIIFAGISLLPFLWLLAGSLKTNIEVLTASPFSLPETPHWGNYVTAWVQGGFREYVKNSVIVTFVSDFLVLVLAAPIGFVFAKRRFFGKQALFALFTLGMILPPQIALTSLFRLLKSLGLLDTYLALILPYAGFYLSLTVFVLRGFFAELPDELSEAAAIDGASSFQLFARILLPLARPILVSLGVLNFVWIWNEFLFALSFIYTNDRRTIPAGLFTFVGRQFSDLGAMAAGIVLSMIPILIVYLLFQRQIVRGLMAGAFKG